MDNDSRGRLDVHRSDNSHLVDLHAEIQLSKKLTRNTLFLSSK